MRRKQLAQVFSLLVINERGLGEEVTATVGTQPVPLTTIHTVFHFPKWPSFVTYDRYGMHQNCPVHRKIRVLSADFLSVPTILVHTIFRK